MDAAARRDDVCLRVAGVGYQKNEGFFLLFSFCLSLFSLSFLFCFPFSFSFLTRILRPSFQPLGLSLVLSSLLFLQWEGREGYENFIAYMYTFLPSSSSSSHKYPARINRF